MRNCTVLGFFDFGRSAIELQAQVHTGRAAFL